MPTDKARNLRCFCQVLVVELDNERLRVTSSFHHATGEVWSIDAAPTNSALLGTVWRSTGGDTVQHPVAVAWLRHP